jgi:transposase
MRIFISKPPENGQLARCLCEIKGDNSIHIVAKIPEQTEEKTGKIIEVDLGIRDIATIDTPLGETRNQNESLDSILTLSGGDKAPEKVRSKRIESHLG